jgi:hypothetical protein
MCILTTLDEYMPCNKLNKTQQTCIHEGVAGHSMSCDDGLSKKAKIILTFEKNSAASRM